MTLSQLFKPNMIRPEIDSRVMHTATRQLGTVIGRSRIAGTFRVFALTVQFDDGTMALQVPEKEFTKLT